MIDDELRQMFTEREPFAPDADRTTGRILRGIPVRRQRTRRRQAVAALAVLAALATVPVLLDEDDTPRQEALVAAGDTAVTLPVTPKWLPEAAVTRTFADAVLSEGMRAISYEFGGAGGILAVQVHSSTRPPTRESPSATPTEPRVPVRGQLATEFESIDRSHEDQSCTLAWQDRPQLWLTVFVRAEGVTPGVACAPARQVAQGLVDRPMELDRPIRFGLVPRDYVLVQAGTNIEAWCPRAGDNQHTPRCVQVRDAAHTLAANGHRVIVRGQIGWLNRTATEVQLVVPGYVEVQTPTPAVDPAIAALTDDDVIRLAESVSLARGW
ncbi:hypothetical protein OHA72_59025 [Dactylosporangium sp. NBC_01737]|uniref:hypothetical protein n=1 Tax=Dactylosporangium sp. NBC_01737 TaxID=2975959 RepID=UPI002E152717|nr:hypothetical protein OHA72_59025 [Dactylosporangium sp. NBC_01737]